MLRWFQSTFHKLDGHGCHYASGIRQLASFPRVTYSTQHASTTPFPKSSQTAITRIVRAETHSRNARTATTLHTLNARSRPAAKRETTSLRRFSSVSLPSALEPPCDVVRTLVNTNGSEELHRKVDEKTDNTEAQLSHLNALISSGDAHCFEQAIHQLREFLEELCPQKAFPDLLWRTILLYSHRFSLEMKESVCLLIFHRIGRHCEPHREDNTLNPPLTPKSVLNMAQLGDALAEILFPCYIPQYAGNCLHNWTIRQAREALSPLLSTEIRWGNLLLLAVHVFPRVNAIDAQISTTHRSDLGTINWRTTLILGTLDKTLSNMGSESNSLAKTVRSISRPLWHLWKIIDHSNQPIDISRAYLASFLRIAAKSRDEPLKDDCFRFAQEHAIWVYRNDDTPAMKAQAIDGIAAYMVASVSCADIQWSDLYAVVARAFSNSSWRNAVTDSLLQHFANENLDAAWSLYMYSKTTHIAVSSAAVHAMCIRLAAGRQWQLVAPFLEDARFSREETEQLLGTCLRVFQVQRHEYANPAFVELLGRVAYELYSRQPPSPALKYPIRYFFSIMITNHNAPSALQLIKAVHHTSPDLFTTRLVLRLALQLVRHQQLHLAVELFRTFDKEAPSRSLDGLRRKLSQRLMVAGSRKLAGKVCRSHGGTAVPSGRESLSRAVGFRRAPMSPVLHRKILPLMVHAGCDGPSIRHAVSLLVRAKRIYAARKLFADSHSTLDPKTHTAIGNIILHGPMYAIDLRNHRLVRHVLHTRDLLVREYGFKPDRATINIIIKAMLRWRAMFDSSHVRRLFDQMVHEGYPVPDQWRRKHGVPFNTPRSPSSGALSIPSLSAHISFVRHIRPLYRLFIKAFYLRNDIPAAKTVVGILKEVDIQHMREMEKRNRARRQGIIKKRLKSRKVD
ncbi:hypothetical protein B0H34DRAFT_756290 [Crassisporium funariophilum]|nr:hypothetical protein B0H34DRAFT_756290 [Crassisporium funariophilum]